MKHAVVTGASGALGAGVVEALLARGMTVHAPMFEDVWKGDPRVHATKVGSLEDERVVTDYYAALPEVYASVHLVGGFAMKPAVETSLAEFEKQWRMNTVTCFLACREAVKRGAKRIVNVAARPAVQPTGGMIAYATAKAGVAALTQALAAELPDVLVNAVLPSLIDSPANRKSMPDADFSKWPKPAEIAAATAYLASPENALTSGALVPVYGRS